MELWAIGRVLEDGTRQVFSNEDGTTKAFVSEAEAQTFIDSNLQGGGAFPFSVDTADATILAPGGNA